MKEKATFTGWEIVNGAVKPITASEKKAPKLNGAGESIKAIEKYRDAYVKAADEIVSVESNTELTADAKAARIDKIGETLAADAEKLRAAAVNALEALAVDYHKARKAAIETGLAKADEIGLIVANINNGAFDAETLGYCLEIYADNPVALESIAGALEYSTDEAYKLMATNIPKDKTAETIKGIGKVIENIKNVPMLDAPIDNLTGGMWRSGQSFNSLIEYLEGLGA